MIRSMPGGVVGRARPRCTTSRRPSHNVAAAHESKDDRSQRLINSSRESNADAGAAMQSSSANRSGVRDHVERVLRLATMLSPTDRVLVEAIYERQLPVKDVAQLLSRHPATVRRRLHRLLMRLDAPLTRFILAHSHTWPQDRRRIARARHVRGCSQRSTAHMLKLSLHRVRMEDRAVLAAFQHARSQTKAE